LPFTSTSHESTFTKEQVQLLFECNLPQPEKCTLFPEFDFEDQDALSNLQEDQLKWVHAYLQKNDRDLSPAIAQILATKFFKLSFPFINDKFLIRPELPDSASNITEVQANYCLKYFTANKPEFYKLTSEQQELMNQVFTSIGAERLEPPKVEETKTKFKATLIKVGVVAAVVICVISYKMACDYSKQVFDEALNNCPDVYCIDDAWWTHIFPSTEDEQNYNQLRENFFNRTLSNCTDLTCVKNIDRAFLLSVTPTGEALYNTHLARFS